MRRLLAYLPLACLLAPAFAGPVPEAVSPLPGQASPGNVATPVVRKPVRIMSMMLCNDLLLLMMVPNDRIVSISYLAHDAVESLLPGADRGVAINHGTAEEILLQKPDLILAGTYSSPMARKLAKTIGAHVVEVGPANSFADIHRIVRQVGQAVGEPERAHALLAEMDDKLAWLASHQPARHLRVVVWSGSQSVPGKGTLTNAIIEASGADNVAARLPDNRYSSFDLEALLAAWPDAILQGETRWSGPSLQDAQSMHPLIERYWHGRRIVYPDAVFACGLPQSADAAIDLRNLYRKLPPGRPQW
ncbi:ABC transporter substrate-binding protein [Thiobacillus sp.]